MLRVDWSNLEHKNEMWGLWAEKGPKWWLPERHIAMRSNQMAPLSARLWLKWALAIIMASKNCHEEQSADSPIPSWLSWFQGIWIATAAALTKTLLTDPCIVHINIVDLLRLNRAQQTWLLSLCNTSKITMMVWIHEEPRIKWKLF